MWGPAWVMCIISVFCLSRTCQSSALLWYYSLGWHSSHSDIVTSSLSKMEGSCHKGVVLPVENIQKLWWEQQKKKKKKEINQTNALNYYKYPPQLSRHVCIVQENCVLPPTSVAYVQLFFFFFLSSFCTFLPGTLIFYRLYKHWVLLAYLVPLT